MNAGGPVFRQRRPGDLRLHPRFFNRVLQPLVFRIRNLIAHGEQMIHGYTIQPFQSCMFNGQAGVVRDTPWFSHPIKYRFFEGRRCAKENTNRPGRHIPQDQNYCLTLSL
jgi:hypothetical protein